MKTLIRNKGSNIKIFLFILGISTWTFPATVNAYDKIIVLNTANDCPNATQSFDGIADRIVKEAFDRLKIKIKRIRLPSERAISNANQGIDDGNYSRIRGLEKTYLNLLMVPVAITNFEFVAFSQNKTISVKSWDSLQAYNVAIIRGWKILETNISKYKSRILVKDEQQLFKMLDNGRVDIIVYDKAQGQYLIKKFDYNSIYIIGKPLAIKEMYLYMHMRHASLVPKIAEILKKMKASGVFARIRKEVEQKYLTLGK